jgi:hypothetical protein
MQNALSENADRQPWFKGDVMGSGASVAGNEPVLRSTAAHRWRRERWFFSGIAVLAAAIVFTGFAPTYYLKGVFGTRALSPLLHVHGALFTSWILLLVAQTTLVAAGRTDIHRRLGVAGGFLAVLMMVAAVLVSIDGARRGAAPPGIPPLMFLIVPLGTVVVFPILIGVAFALRRQPDAHKRLMVIGTAELLTAGVGRLPGIAAGGPLAFFGVTDLFIVGLWAYDYLTRGRVHPAALWGGLFFIVSQPLRIAVGGTGLWLAFASWLTR